jgi:hypothetical protein
MRDTRIERVLGDVNERWPQPDRVAWIAALEAIYERNEVLADGFAPALQRSCPSCGVCWDGAAHRRQPETPADVGDGENASIFWPWVGKHYRRGGVCIVSLNINHAEAGWWSIAVEYAIAGAMIESFEAGDRTPFGRSLFSWRLLCTANAVVASLDGRTPTHEPDTVERAADVLERISRVQAVKCAPLGDRSYPTDAMRVQCPERFALRELEVLQPGVLVALGNDAFEAVQLLRDEGAVWVEKTDHFQRGALELPHGDVAVLWLYHPNSHGLWKQGQVDLVASLRARPLIGG